MLSELSDLFVAVPDHATRAAYADSIVIENCLGKRTASTRKTSYRRLTELYALEPDVILFRVMRDLWDRDPDERPLMALLVALARDPLLRTTANSVISAPAGESFDRRPMKKALASDAGDRLAEATLDKVVRNASSSWTQSGHLAGIAPKVRQKVRPTAGPATLALLLGFATGRRGSQLFDTPWTAVLDTGFSELIDLAEDANRQGLLDFRHSGDMIEVSFWRLLTDSEREWLRGTN